MTLQRCWVYDILVLPDSLAAGPVTKALPTGHGMWDLDQRLGLRVRRAEKRVPCSMRFVSLTLSFCVSLTLSVSVSHSLFVCPSLSFWQGCSGTIGKVQVRSLHSAGGDKCRGAHTMSSVPRTVVTAQRPSSDQLCGIGWTLFLKAGLHAVSPSDPVICLLISSYESPLLFNQQSCFCHK